MWGYPGINPRLRVAHIAATALVFACASSKSAESSFSQERDTQTDRNIVKTVERGPERVTVLEFAPPKEEAPTTAVQRGPPVGVAALPTRLGARPLAGTPDDLPLHGPLIKATITEQAPITTTTKAETATHQEASVKAQGDSHSASKPSLGFLVWPWLLGLAGAAIAAFLVWKLKPSWIGWVVKLFKLGA